jgi:tetratricopeptide (TPR) repeat protein
VASGRHDGKSHIELALGRPTDKIASVRKSATESPLVRLRRRLEKARGALRDGDLQKAFDLSRKVIEAADNLTPTPEAVAVSGSAHVLIGQVADAAGEPVGAEAEFGTAIGLLRDAHDVVWMSSDHVADLGVAMLMTGSPDAGAPLRRAIELGDDTVLVRRFLGLFLLGDGQLVEADELLTEVVRTEPSDWRAWRGLAMIAETNVAADDAARLWLTTAEMIKDAGRSDDALEAYLAADRLSPSLDAKRGAANSLSQLGRFAEAERTASEVLAAHPDDYQTKVVRVEALLGMDRDADAATGARELTQIEPGDPVAHAYLGIALKALGRYDDAVAALRDSRRILPESAPIRIHLANALAATDEIDEAMRVLAEGIELDPDDLDLRLARAELAAAAAEFDAAETDAVAIEAVDPSRAPWLSLAQSMAVHGDLERALETVDRALAILPDDAYALGLRGAILTHLERIPEGLASLRESLDREPTALALNNLVVALSRPGADHDVQQAEEFARRLVDLEPDDADSAVMLAGVLLDTDRAAEAVDVLDAAAERCPPNRNLEFERAKALLLSGRPQLALDTLDAATDQFGLDGGLQDLRARGLADLGRPSEAVEAAKRAAAELPDVAGVHAHLGLLHRDLAFADDHIDDQHMSAAVAALTHAIELDPGDIDSTTLLGQLHAERNELDDAERLLSKARWLRDVTGAEVDAFALADLGRVWHLKGEHDAALAAVDEAIRLDASYGNALLTKGEALYALDRFTESVEALQQALLIKKDDAYLLSRLGESYRMLGEHVKADEALTAALELAPGDAYALASRGAVRYVVGDLESAVADLESALGGAPSYQFALDRYLLVQLDLGRVDNALAAWQKARTVAPDDPEIQIGYADTLRLAGQSSRGIPIIEQVLREVPTHVLALRVFGRMLLELGRIDEAAAQFDRALALEPDSAAATTDLAEAQDKQGRPWCALKTIQAAVERNSTGELLVDYGWRLAKLAAWPGALDAARQARELEPGSPGPYQLLSWVLPLIGDREECVEVAAEAVRLGPESSWSHKQLGNTLWWIGQNDEAMREYTWVAERAGAIADDDAQGLHILGWSLMCLGEHNRAAGCLSKAAALGFDELSALLDLGVNSLAAGQMAEADRTFDEALALVDRDMSEQVDRGNSERRTRSERALAHRGSIAVAIYDLQSSVERHRLPPSPEVDRVVAELATRLELLTLPVE